MFGSKGWEERSMSEPIGGIVRNGVVVPDAPLPEGMRVEVRIATRPLPVPPELQEEFDAWDRASDQTLEAFEKMVEGDRQDETR
jgi:hypothetical protein